MKIGLCKKNYKKKKSKKIKKIKKMEDSVSRWVKFVEETGIAHHKVNEIAHTCADEFASPETLWSIISHQKEDEAKSFMEQLIPNPFSRAAFFSHLTRCFSSVTHVLIIFQPFYPYFISFLAKFKLFSSSLCLSLPFFKKIILTFFAVPHE